MNKGKNLKKVILQRTVFVIGITVFFIILAKIFPPVFETNDDRTMRSIIQGDYGEKYSAYPIYMGYPLSLLLSRLYMTLPVIPWYGAFFSGCIILSALIVVGNIIFDKKNSRKQTSIILFILVVVYISIFLIQQFTVVSGILMCTAIYLCVNNKSKIAIILLGCLSFEIRSNVFLMLSPFLIAAGIWHEYESKIEVKRTIKEVLPLFIIIVSIFMIGTTINRVAYSSKEWKEYNDYNHERTVLYDNKYFCDSSEYKEECLKAGISEKEYYLTNTYQILLDKDIGIGQIQKINSVIEEKKKDNVFVKMVKVIYYLLKNSLIAYWKYTFILILLDIMWLFFNKYKKQKVIIYLCTMLGKYVIFSYLVWIARLPERVFIPLFIATLMFIVDDIAKNSSKKRIHMMINVLVLVCSVLILNAKVSAYQQLRLQNKQYYTVCEYCEKNKNSKYMLGINGISSCSAYVLENKKTKLFYLEPWLSKSPIINEYLKNNHSLDFGQMLLKKDVYYILYAHSPIEEFQNYMDNRFNGVQVKKVYEINENYYVYKFEKQ